MSTTLSPVTALTQLHLDTSWPSPSTALVAVVGEVDLATAHLLRDGLLNVLREQATAIVDVDLAGSPSWTAPASAHSSPSATPPSTLDARCGSATPNRSSAGYWN
jgi:hypothetical protein